MPTEAAIIRKRFKKFNPDVKMKALKYLSEGHTPSYVQTLLKKEGYLRIPQQQTIKQWKRKLPAMVKGQAIEKRQAELVLESIKKVTTEFEWLYNKNRDLIDRWYNDPDTYSKELIFAIKEHHMLLQTAMKKLDMIKGNIEMNVDEVVIMNNPFFHVATNRFLEDLVKQGKIEIHDPMLKKMILVNVREGFDGNETVQD